MDAARPRLVTPGTRWLAVLVILAHVFFFSAALFHQSFLTDDSIQYLTLSENLLQDGVFSQSYFSDLTPDVQRTPGYPVFLALCGNQPVVILLLQHLLVLLGGWMLFQTLAGLTGLRNARIGAWAWLLQPYPMVLSSFILSEGLFIFLLALGFWQYLIWRRGGPARAGLIAGLALLLAFYVRPVGLVVLVVAAADMLWQCMRRRNWKAPLVAVVMVVLALGPWLMRNQALTGSATVSTMGRMGMLHGRLGGAFALERGGGLEEHRLYMHGDSLAAEAVGWENVRTYLGGKQTHETEQLYAGATGLTLGYLARHPREGARMVAVALGQMVKGVGFGWTRQLCQSEVLAWVMAVIQLGFNGLMFGGLILSLVFVRKWKSVDYFFFAQIIGLYGLSAAIWADGRYRVPIDFVKMIKIISKIEWVRVALRYRKQGKKLDD